jgi:hypothetical protein
MNILKFIYIPLILFQTSAVFSSELDSNLSFDQKMNSLKMEKIQAELIIEMMSKRGRLNKTESGKAKREIASVIEDDVDDLKVEANERIAATKSKINN